MFNKNPSLFWIYDALYIFLATLSSRKTKPDRLLYFS